MSMGKAVVEKPVAADAAAAKLDDMMLVVLHNDDVNSMEHVVRCLRRVFGLKMELAVKIMMEAHHRGSATAAVEPEPAALLHRDQLRSFGLSATVEEIS